MQPDPIRASPRPLRERGIGKRTDGRKERPVAVGALPGRSHSLFPISAKQPEAFRIPAETPAHDRLRTRLDPSFRIILDEFYTDLVGQSFYVEPLSADLPLQRETLPANVARVHCLTEEVSCAQPLPVDIRAAVVIGRGVGSIFQDVLPFRV